MCHICTLNWCEHFVCISYQPAPKIRICRYVCTSSTSPTPKQNRRPSTDSERHTHSATVIAQRGARNNYGQRYGGCSCCLMDIESLMIRRPFGSIDPNSIRETELHTECRRRRERESLYSPQHDRERDVHQLVISRLPRYVYVSTYQYVPGWGTYYVPHTWYVRKLV